MLKPISLALLLALGASTFGALGHVHADAPATVAAQLGDEIRTGQLAVDGRSVEFGTAVGVVDEPYTDVLAVLSDYGNYHHFLPHFRTSRVLAQRGSDAMVYLEVGVLRDTVTLWGQMRMSQRPDGEGVVIEARMTQGNMDEFRARWEVTPLDGGARALVTFHILVEPDLPVPSSVLTHENVKAARRAVRALRQRVREV